MNSYSIRYYQLIEQYKLAHSQGMVEQSCAEKVFSGHSLLPHVTIIRDLIYASRSESVLDFGCGKATCYFADDLALPNGVKIGMLRDYWGVSEIALYDPAVPAFSELPAKEFDGVICTDVLEHIDERDIDLTLEIIFRKARSFVFANIASYAAEKHLPNGENAHATVRDPDWWSARIDKASRTSQAAFRISIQGRDILPNGGKFTFDIALLTRGFPDS